MPTRLTFGEAARFWLKGFLVLEDTLKKLFAATLAVLAAACGNPDAYVNDTSSGLIGSKNPSKAADEKATVESDLSASEAALTLSTNHVALCGAGESWARCFARARVNGAGQVHAASTPQGLGPADIQAAYKLPATGGEGLTVGIVDANDDPTAEADLAVYRSQYGLPPCTTANGCFKKVNQRGAASPLPAADTGWAGEIALDLDMVSAACPTCKILLVEADSATMDNLGAAVNTAASMGAIAISNSYGGSEDSSVVSADSTYFNHPGVFITASSGDNGYGASYPATSAHVTAVGGTALTKSTNSRGWSETAWSGAGSGCSAFIAKPSWQHDTGCAKRMEADVSAVADPNTGVAVYVTYGGSGGWNVYGGTSASSPIVAATFAVTAKSSQDNSYSYANPGQFFDVTSGSNGTCTASYQCKAGAGYDGPTGNGTPNGALLSGAGGGTGGGSTGGGAGGGTGGGSTGGGTGGGSTGGGTGGGSTGGGIGGGTGGGSTGGGVGGGTGGGSTGGGVGGGTGGGSTGGGTGGGTGSSTETEPNNSRGTANLLTSGVPLTGSITAGDVDYFRIVASPGNTLDLKLNHLTADCDLSLYNSSGALLAISDNGGTTAEEITGTLINSVYYAKVKGYAGAKCDYQLSLTIK